MNGSIGFDRLLELDWLDLFASRLVETRDQKTAFYDARAVVAATVGGGESHNNAAGKTMTVLSRVWLKVPAEVAGLRDAAAVALPGLDAFDRTAIHWGMCELAYPFYMDAAAIVGRALALHDDVALSTVRARLTDRWGARGTMGAASQRILKMWERWAVLAPKLERGSYSLVPPRPVGDVASRLLAEIRVLADQNRAVDLDDLQRAPDLFPFLLPDLRPLLSGSVAVQLNREGGRRIVVRPVL